MPEKIQSFKDLFVWQKAMRLVKLIYLIINRFPQKEAFCLTDQMRRSAISIPSNIAEGFRRQHAKEFKQFLSIARGSIAELETQLIIADDFYPIDKILMGEILEIIDHVSRMIFVLYRRL